MLRPVAHAYSKAPKKKVFSNGRNLPEPQKFNSLRVGIFLKGLWPRRARTPDVKSFFISGALSLKGFFARGLGEVFCKGPPGGPSRGPAAASDLVFVVTHFDPPKSHLSVFYKGFGQK